jgi:hypothetical protein
MTDPIAKHVKKLIGKAWEDSKKPRGLAKSAIFGAEIRQRVLSLVEKVEADLGQMAVAFAKKEGVLLVHPKLSEEIQKHPDKDIIEPSFDLCFPTPDAKRQLNASWPSVVAKYHNQSNTDALLREKSAVLATFVSYNIDIGIQTYEQMNENVPELTEEQETESKLEEAACWVRIIDELAHRYLSQSRPLFMDHFGDNLVEILALQGMPPDSICSTIIDRMKEYGQYRQWIPEGKNGAAGTLLWEVAKHVGKPLGTNKDIFFLMTFKIHFLELLIQSLASELFSGSVRTTG